MPQKLFNYLPVGEPIRNIYTKLKWLMLARAIFTFFLLGSTLFLHFRGEYPNREELIAILYVIIGAIFLLSLFYGLLARRVKRQRLFAYFQIGVDSFIVTLIVLITGGYYSFFSFLYLVVIIYASMILYFQGGIILASLSSIQYALLITLQYYAIMPPVGAGAEMALYSHSWLHIVYNILITASACFAVAILSGLLTEQNRKSQRELRTMEAHVERVEKMAYMGEMAAGLAHEIKNPLASLVGSIQLLKEDLHFDKDHQRLMEIVLRETDRLNTLVNDFLFFARPPTGKPEKLNLKEAVEEIAALFEKDTNYARRFNLKKSLLPDVWVVMDPTHLRQVLWNLLLNAAEAIEEAGQIEIKSVLNKTGEISTQVIDDGCGIPADVVQSIFNPFYTTKPEGTGLGLSIVHRILEAYDSRLDVHTVNRAGTTFSFALKKASAPSELPV